MKTGIPHFNEYNQSGCIFTFVSLKIQENKVKLSLVGFQVYISLDSYKVLIPIK